MCDLPAILTHDHERPVLADVRAGGVATRQESIRVTADPLMYDPALRAAMAAREPRDSARKRAAGVDLNSAPSRRSVKS